MFYMNWSRHIFIFGEKNWNHRKRKDTLVSFFPLWSCCCPAPAEEASSGSVWKQDVGSRAGHLPHARNPLELICIGYACVCVGVCVCTRVQFVSRCPQQMPVYVCVIVSVFVNIWILCHRRFFHQPWMRICVSARCRLVYCVGCVSRLSGLHQASSLGRSSAHPGTGQDGPPGCLSPPVRHRPHLLIFPLWQSRSPDKKTLE